MAAEEWNRKLDRVTERTERYIRSKQKKMETCTDPKERAVYQSKINRMYTLFQTTMASINANADHQEQMVREISGVRPVKCGG